MLTANLWDWMGTSAILDQPDLTGEPFLGMPIVNLPSPFAAGSTPIYLSQIVDPYGTGIPAADFSVLTLTLADTLSGAIINSVNQVNILNTGRGTIDSSGNLQIQLTAADTAMDEVPGAAQVQRSMIIDWTYATSGPKATSGTGRHQANFILLALAGP